MVCAGAVSLWSCIDPQSWQLLKLKVLLRKKKYYSKMPSNTKKSKVILF